MFPDTLRIVRDIYQVTEGRLAINACGGIFTAADAIRCIRAGASTVQLYTGFVYQGPRVVREMDDIHGHAARVPNSARATAAARATTEDTKDTQEDNRLIPWRPSCPLW